MRHRHPLLVSAVIVAEQFAQAALFEKDSNQDVGARHGCEEEMPDRHLRCGPEGHDKPQVDWMAHELVVKRRPELRRRHLGSHEIGRGLMQPESSKPDLGHDQLR
jgi:hypothetical protein